MKHIDFIKELLEPIIKKQGILYVGNHLNKFFTFKEAEAYADSLKKRGTDRVQKSSKDPITGRLVEELIVYLLQKYFDHNQLNYKIFINNNTMHDFRIVHQKMRLEKVFDIDIVIWNEKDKKQKYYLLSCKGSVRERIGQYISNLFLMDDRLIKTKYNDRYYLDFHKKGKTIKYGLVSLDWARAKDFVKKNKIRGYKKHCKTNGGVFD